MKGLIAYRSRYGATREYAEWLAQETGMAVKPIQEVGEADLKAIDFLVLGSSVRIGKIEAGKWLEEHWDLLSGKKIILFTVSLTPPEDEEISKIVERSISQEIIAVLDYYPLPGRLRPDRLSFLDRQMTRFRAKGEEDPQARQALLEGIDNVDRGRIAPIIEAIEKIRGAPEES